MTAAEKAASPSSGKKKTIIAVCVIAALILVFSAAGIGYYYYLTTDDGLIYDNVYVGNINLGGLTPEEAKNALVLTYGDSYTTNDMVITLPESVVRITPGDAGIQPDLDAAVAAAYQHGREGSRFEQYQAKKAAADTEFRLDLVNYLNLDTVYIQNVVDQIIASYNTTFTEATAVISGERPPLEADKVAEDVEHQVLTVTIGIPGSSLSGTKLYGMIMDAYSANAFAIAPEFPWTVPERPDLQKIFDEFCVKPVDAQLDTDTYLVSQEVYGYGFDTETYQPIVDAAGYGQVIEIPLEYIAPEITQETIESTMFQDKLASYKAYQASTSNRINNLAIACNTLNGIIIKPGEVFSYNDALGERTTEKGYLGAAAYVGGESVNSIGGGICQISTALYYCTLLADLEIVERTAHMYPSSYIGIGLDATVYWNYLDFKFRNNTPYPIRIEAVASGGTTTVTLYGTDDKDYYVKMEAYILETYDYETIYKEFDEDNSKGYKDGDIVQSPHTGYKAVSYRCKYRKSDDTLISREFEAYSYYTKTDKIICRIKQEETQPPVTEPPTDPPTEPSTPSDGG